MEDIPETEGKVGFDMLIITDDGRKLKCCSTVLKRNSEELSFAIELSRSHQPLQTEQQNVQQQDAQDDADGRPAKKRKTAEGAIQFTDDEKDLLKVKLPGDCGKAWKDLWQQYDDRHATPPISWDSVEGVLVLAHKYRLDRALENSLSFLQANMAEMNVVENKSACIINWLIIAKQREQPELYKTLKARLREYCAVLETACKSSDGTAANHSWKKDSLGPWDKHKIHEQAMAAIGKLSEGTGQGLLLQSLDEEVKYVIMRMASRVLLTVAKQCIEVTRRVREAEKKVRLAKCADCPKSLCHESKAYCSKCVHKKLYAKKKCEDGLGPGGKKRKRGQKNKAKKAAGGGGGGAGGGGGH